MKKYNNNIVYEESGEWENEPDKIQWVDKTTNLDCLIVRNRSSGHLCGYVGIPSSHKDYEVGYPELDYSVHGGLTFSDKCHDEAEESTGICHLEDIAANKNVWWLGFDCAHFNDKTNFVISSTLIEGVYRNVEYVTKECESLAKQLVNNT